MILPNLDDRIAWYKDVMRPDDPALGAGIADWTITWEWRPALAVGGVEAWDCMCSPPALPEMKPLTPEDVAAKRAHLIFRTPESQSDLGEIERTLRRTHHHQHTFIQGCAGDGAVELLGRSNRFAADLRDRHTGFETGTVG